MKSSIFIYGLCGLLIGLIIGFWIANAASGDNQAAAIIKQNTAAPIASENSPDKNEVLSPEEINAAFQSAEIRKDDFAFQKNLALALHQYSKVQSDTSFMPQLVKLLERANELSNQRDSEVLSVLADTYFAIAREKRDKDAREKALDAFRQATNLKPEDSALKTAYAAGLIFAEPAQAEKAIKQLEAALKLDPKNQNAMQLLVLALVQTGKTKTAEDKLAELKTLDANNPAIPELENQIAQQKASKKL